ncbi:hypothetical protein NU195Hw_g8770t1 [Hortaea werneckii]
MTTTPRAYTVLSCVFKLPSNSRSGRKTARAIATSTDLHDANVAAMNYMINAMRDRDEQIELCESAVPDSVMPDSLAAFFKIKPEFDKTKIEYSNEGRVKLSVAIRSKPHQRPGSEYIYCFVSQDAQAAAYIQGFFDRNNPEWHTRRAMRSYAFGANNVSTETAWLSGRHQRTKVNSRAHIVEHTGLAGRKSSQSMTIETLQTDMSM